MLFVHVGLLKGAAIDVTIKRVLVIQVLVFRVLVFQVLGRRSLFSGHPLFRVRVTLCDECIMSVC